MRLQMITTQTLRQVMMSQLHKWDKGEAGEDEGEEDGRHEDRDTDGEGWDAASDRGSWADQGEEQDLRDF